MKTVKTLVCVMVMLVYSANNTYAKSRNLSYKVSSKNHTSYDSALKQKYKKYAKERVLDIWKHAAHVDALFWIIENESKWNPLAQNSYSSAFGIGQFLDSTWKLTGYQKTEDPYKQIDAMIKYIKISYGTPLKAKKIKEKKGWY